MLSFHMTSHDSTKNSNSTQNVKLVFLYDREDVELEPKKSDGVCTSPSGECQLPVSQSVVQEGSLSKKKKKGPSTFHLDITCSMYMYVNVKSKSNKSRTTR